MDRHAITRLALIRSVMHFVTPDGALFFSTPKRKFTMDKELMRDYNVSDISVATTPPDFDRRRPHHAFTVRR